MRDDDDDDLVSTGVCVGLILRAIRCEAFKLGELRGIDSKSC